VTKAANLIRRAGDRLRDGAVRARARPTRDVPNLLGIRN